LILLQCTPDASSVSALDIFILLQLRLISVAVF